MGADTGLSMPADALPAPASRVIATAAGAFSGLFGVGGGTVIVPLLILWLGYEEKEATGTSLAAIVVIAALAAAAQAAYGNVDIPKGAADRHAASAARGRGRAPAAPVRARGVRGFAVLLVIASAILVF